MDLTTLTIIVLLVLMNIVNRIQLRRLRHLAEQAVAHARALEARDEAFRRILGDLEKQFASAAAAAEKPGASSNVYPMRKLP